MMTLQYILRVSAFLVTSKLGEIKGKMEVINVRF